MGDEGWGGGVVYGDTADMIIMYVLFIISWIKRENKITGKPAGKPDNGEMVKIICFVEQQIKKTSVDIKTLWDIWRGQVIFAKR